MFNEKLKSEWQQLFSGGPETRKKLYGYFETDSMRALFKGPDGVLMYEEIIGIAAKAGAPMDEVRAQLTPLVGEERVEAHVEEQIGKFIKSGGLESALNKNLESMKQETERKLQGLTELKAAAYDSMVEEQEKRKKQSWLRRLFS